MAVFLILIGILLILLGYKTFGLIWLVGSAMGIVTAYFKVRSLHGELDRLTHGLTRQGYARQIRMNDFLLLLVMAIAVIILVTVSTDSTDGQFHGQIDKVEISSQDGATVFRVKMKGDPARTFVATYTSRADIEHGRDLLKSQNWVILDYHGPVKGGDQVIDKVSPWTNR